jgi:predicted molibdopterin-dependent oxidoreductase YjgC
VAARYAKFSKSNHHCYRSTENRNRDGSDDPSADPAKKRDLMLLYGLAKILVDEGWINRSYIDTHTEDFNQFATFLEKLSLSEVAARSGISLTQLRQVAKVIHEGKCVSFWWTMGVNGITAFR